jgi:hypothetical protein
MDAAGSSATPPARSPAPFALGAPDRKPASLPGVERILAGLLAARRIVPTAAQPSSRRCRNPGGLAVPVHAHVDPDQAVVGGREGEDADQPEQRVSRQRPEHGAVEQQVPRLVWERVDPSPDVD